MTVETLPYEQLVKKVEELEKRKLYEHRIKISKSYNQGTTTDSFTIYLTVYRRTSAEITNYLDIWKNVISGVVNSLNIGDSPSGFFPAIGCSMGSDGKIYVTYCDSDGNSNTCLVDADSYTITDTVTEV